MAIVCLLVAQAVLLTWTAWRTGPGWDEWGHLPSGLFTLQYGDFHPYCVNPPLVRLLAAVPVVLLGGGIDFEILPKTPGFRSEAYLGMAYIHQQGPQVFKWISLARMMVIPIAMFGTVLLFRISRHFGNDRSGFFAATLWVFSPMVLAYGATITPDVGATVFGLWAIWCFYIWYRLGRLGDSIWLGVSVAAALLSKSTWVILPPLLLLSYLILGRIETRRFPATQRWKQIGLAALVAWLLVHAAYDFRGVLRPLGSFEFVSQSLGGARTADASGTGNRFAGTPLGWIPVPLPADYIKGIDLQKRDFESNFTSYLMGKSRDHGWWHYYGVAWLVKEPLAFWVILVLGWGLALLRRPVTRLRAAPIGWIVLLIPGLVVFLFVSSQTGFNHHLRYVLPAFPAAFLIAAHPVAQLRRRSRWALFVLLGWFVFSSASMVPQSYAFFSAAIGGWRNGHLYLNGSNLDWGQDLPTIRRWIQANPDKRPVHLLYSPSQLDFQRLGIDASIGEGAMGKNGPRKDGWWVVSIDRCLAPPNCWFLDRTPHQRLSVSTTVYHIENGQVAQP